MSAQNNQPNLRTWWNSLDKLWQKILLFNLGVEIELGGIRTHYDWQHFEYWILENLYDKGDLGNQISIEKEISDYILNQIVNLDVLIVQDAGITDLSPLSRLDKLIFLNCSHNKIKDISPLNDLINLQELDLCWNNITSLDPLKNLKNLRTLNIWMNNILSLAPIENLENLEELNCLHNMNDKSYLIPRLRTKWKKLKSLSADEISNLQYLPELCPDLESLYVQGLKGDLSTIIKLKRLQVLHIHTNQLKNINPLATLPDLKVLSIGRNQIKSLEPLSSLHKLEYLDFSINKIKDLLPLINLTKLETLICMNNSIESLTPLKRLVNLSSVDISNDLITSQVTDINKVTDLSPLNHHKNLKYLNCKHNPLHSGDIEIFKIINPNCEVSF